MKYRLRCDACGAESRPSRLGGRNMFNLYEKCIADGWRIMLGDKMLDKVADVATWPMAFAPFEKHHCPRCAKRVRNLIRKVVGK